MFLANNQSGKLRIGGLLMLVVVAAGGYCAFAFGRVYWHRYSIREAMDRQLSFAGQLGDEAIRQKLVNDIAGMHLPPAASRVQMSRPSPRTIQISIRYTETVNLLFMTRQIPVYIEEHRSY